MKILSFRASNYKKLKAVEIKPDGTEVVLSGRNGSGKTAILDGIMVALQGLEDKDRKKDPKPIREGADYAAIDLEVGDFKVRRTFFGEGGQDTNLVITSKDGVQYRTPTALAKAWWSKIGCDPLSFMRQRPEDQVEELKSLIRFEGDDAEVEAATTERTDTNRRLKELKTLLAAGEVPLADLPKKPIDTAALADKLQGAITHNEAVNAAQRQIELLRQQATTARDNAHARRAHINQLLAQIKEDEAAEAVALADFEELTSKANSLKVHEPIDTAALAEEIRNADATNAQIRKRDARRELEKEQAELTAKVEKLDAKIKAAAEEKRKAVADAKLPVRGLTLEDKQILYRGIPLQQTSSSDQIKVAMAIAMAKKPELRIVRIEEGSLLDEDSRQVVFDMARKADFQVWMEVVDTSGEVGIVIEEGEVKKVNPVGATAKKKGKK